MADQPTHSLPEEPLHPRIVGVVTADSVRHVVCARETLADIAARHHVSASSIMVYNQLNSPHELYVGQVLHIPTEEDQ